MIAMTQGSNAVVLKVHHTTLKERLLSGLDDYLDFLDVLQNTKETYRFHITDFINKCKHPDEPSSVVLYINDLRERCSALTASTRVNIIKSYLRYLNDFEILENKVYLLLKVKTKYRGGSKAVVPKDKLTKMLSKIDRSTLTGMRDYAFIRLLQSTGMRISEPLGCKVADLVIKDGIPLLYFVQKGRKKTCARLFDKTYNAIISYLNARGVNKPDDPLFGRYSGDGISGTYVPVGNRAMQLVVKKAFESVGLTGSQYTSHSFRYSKAYDVFTQTGDESKGSAALRHSSPKTIQYYTAQYREELNAINQIDTEI